MYLYDFRRLLRDLPEHQRRQFEDELQDLLNAGRFREACNLFAAHVPLDAPALFSDDYFRSHATYNFAMLQAHLGNAGEAALLMAQAGVRSAGDWQDLIYSEHLRLAGELEQRQQEAIAAGRPGLLITSLPKAASAFVSQILASALDVPVLRASIGLFPRNAVVTNWAAAIAEGGCVTHDHFGPDGGNLERLAAAGIRHLFVQVRDPRGAMLSGYHFGRRFEPRDLDAMFESFFLPAVAWLDGWIAAAADGPLRVEFIDFEDIRRQAQPTLMGVLGKVLPADAAAACAARLEVALAEQTPANFRSGTSEEWRRTFPEPLQAAMWDAMSPRVKAQLCLLP